MSADASRPPTRSSLRAAAWAILCTTVALTAVATLVVACTPPRDTGVPTPGPTIAALERPSTASRGS